MARPTSSPNIAARSARASVPRDFIWIVARNRTTGAHASDGMWSGVGTRMAEVINPDTGSIDSRQFFGAGTLVSVSDIALVSSTTVQRVTIRMSQVHDRVEQLVRAYDVKQARVEIYRGFYDPVTRNQVGPAECRFVGFVDAAPITTPAEGGDGFVELTCTSHTQEMSRGSTDTRSHDSQRQRHATDDFYKDTAVAGDWEISWGKKSGKVDSSSPKDRFLGMLPK